MSVLLSYPAHKRCPTAMELRGLNALQEQHNGCLHISDFRRALKAKGRGFYLVLHRMLEASWIVRVGDEGGVLSLTVGGLRAIARSEGMAEEQL